MAVNYNIPLQTQLEYMMQELQGPESATLDAFGSGTAISPQDYAEMFEQKYERSGGEGMGKRRQYALEIFRSIDEGTFGNLPDNVQTAFNFFKGQGFTDAQAAGIVGNLQVESFPMINPQAYNPEGGGLGAYGIAQFRGPRLKGLLQYAGKQGENTMDGNAPFGMPLRATMKQDMPQQRGGMMGGIRGLLDYGAQINPQTGLSRFETFAAALDPLIMPSMRGGEAIRARGAQRVQTANVNQTVNWLRSNGYADLANIVQQNPQMASQVMAEIAKQRLTPKPTEDPDKLLKRISDARKEFTGLKAVKDFSDVSSAYSRVINSASDPSAAGDLALIFNFMKVLDPGSVVREGEFATAQNAGGVDERIRSLYNRVVDGTRLTVPQRADFVDRATRLYVGAENQYKSIAEQYADFAKQAGLDPKLVIPDFGFKGTRPERPTILQVPENPDTARFPTDEDWKKHWQTVMTEEQRREFLEGQMADLTEKQRQIIDQSLQQEQLKKYVPTQRTRALAQGVTFGFADEIEAAIRSLGPGEYNELLSEVRGAVKEYQQARPGEAIAYEVGGAALPALIAGLFTGGAGTVAALGSRFPTVAKVLGIAAPSGVRGALGVGAAQGALTGIGTGETVEERALGAGIGTVTGGALGGAVQTVAPYITGLATSLVDFVRRRVGGRGSKAVENELQRLATESGMSVDEIVEGVASGRIMAENRTLLDAVRSFRASGGPAASRLRQTLEARPQLTREEAMSQISDYLSEIEDPNILRGMKAGEEEARILERQEYARFKTQKASPEVVSELETAVKNVPESQSALNRIYQSATGDKPFVTIKDDGTVEFADDITVEQAEVVRRTISNLASREFQPGGIGTVGEAFGDVEKTLREALDLTVPELAETRAKAATTRSAREAFQEGQRVLSKSPDIVELELEQIRGQGEAALKAYRTGVLQALRNRMRTGSMRSMMTNLSDPDRKEGQILRIVIPQDELDDVLRAVERAAQSQQAATSILGGSQTAITAAQQARQGMGVNVGDVAEALGGSPMAAGRVIRDVVKQAAPSLNDAERLQIVNILTSENPDIVRNALVDESGLAAFQAAVERLAASLTAGAQRGVSVGAPIVTQQMGLLE